MSRGIVVCPNFEFSEQNIKLSCFLDEIDIRRNLLYWDNIAYAFPNGLGKPNLDAMTDLKYLHDQKLLTLEDISVSTEEIGKQHIQQSETNAMFTSGPPTPDNPSGVLVLGLPATIWGDFCQFAQIKVAELKQSSGTNTWTIGQSGAQLSLPSGKANKANLIEARIYSGLPVPSADTPLDEILEFKEKRAEELIRFRHFVDQLYISLLSSPDQERELRIVVEKIDLALIDLYRCLNENKIKTLLDTLRLYINIDNPTLFTLIGGFLADTAEFPLKVGAAAGLAFNTLLTFGSRCIEKPTTIPTDLKDFMYVYEVTKQWPVKQI